MTPLQKFRAATLRFSHPLLKRISARVIRLRVKAPGAQADPAQIGCRDYSHHFLCLDYRLLARLFTVCCRPQLGLGPVLFVQATFLALARQSAYLRLATSLEEWT